MFIAINRFKVPKGSEQAFEELWLSRETHLDGNPGFVVFHLLKGPTREDHVLRLRPGRGRSRFGRLTPGPGRTSPSTSIIRSSRGSTFCKRCGRAAPQFLRKRRSLWFH